MNEEKLGIAEVKSVLLMGLSTGELLDSLVDGVGISDLKPLLKTGLSVKPAIDAINSGKFIPELKDLDDAEKTELKQFIRDNFDLKEDNLEIQIEAGLEIAVDLCDLLKIMQKKG